MATNSNTNSIMVLGLGNILLGDEGFGVHVVRRLKQVGLPASVRIEEGGVGGFDLLGLIANMEKLLVIDVMMTDIQPGELRLIGSDRMPGEPGKQIISFHQIGVLELMHLAELVNCRPEVTFLVTRPKKMDWSLELSPALQSAVDKAVEEVKNWCTKVTVTT